jgi:putative chitinase
MSGAFQMTITPAVLKRIAPHARARIIDPAAPLLEEWMPKLAIVGELRQAHFLAQLGHESDGFRTTVEYASGAAYEGRDSLGNTEPGDGRRFKGRGLIQCTGRANYREFTAWIWARDPSAPNFVEQPELVAEMPWAVLSALWFWSVRALNHWADQNDLRAVTKRVNGGFNGLAERARYLTLAKEALAEPAVLNQAVGLRRGAEGDAVRELQANLLRLGRKVVVDGQFGPATERAVVQFQRDHQLTADGIVGPKTAAEILQALANLET